MVCSNCDAEINKINVYCNNCGKKLKASKIDNWKHVVVDDGFNSMIGGLSSEICQSFGFEAIKNQQYYEALEYYDRATKFKNIDKKNLSDSYTGIAVAYQRIGDINEALNFNNLAILSNPSNFSAIGNRASIKIQLEDDLSAISDLEILINNSQMKPNFWFYLGVAYENIESLDKAKVAYEKAIAEGFNLASDYLTDVIKRIHNKSGKK